MTGPTWGDANSKPVRPPARPGPTRLAKLLTRTVVMVSLLASCTAHAQPSAGENEAVSTPDPPETVSATHPPEKTPPSYSQPKRYETGRNSEAIAGLPVPTRATSKSKRVVYSQRLTLTEGQLLLATSEFQVTNDFGYNVFVASQIVLAKQPGATRGRAITAANGRNVTPGMHHDQQSKIGTYEVTNGDAGSRYVNLVVWSAASQARTADRLQIDAGYGDLSLLVW